MRKNIFVRQNSILHRIDPSEILFINADGNYCIINTINGKKYAVKTSLKAMATKLDEGFAQVHRGYIVPVCAIESIDTIGQSMIVGGKEIPFGRKFKDTILSEKIILL